MFDYLEKLRLKPGHVRERIAFGTAGATTAIVALGWIIVTASSGTFMLNPGAIVGSSQGNQIGSAIAQTKDGVTSLLGAAAAYSGSGSGIKVETVASTTVNAPTPTVLPF